VIKLIYIPIFLVFVSSCESILCGSLDKETKYILDKGVNKYGKYFEVETIPCEYYYLNAYFRSDSVKDILVDSLHSDLYNPITRRGWRSIHVFDRNKNFLYKHHHSGKIDNVVN